MATYRGIGANRTAERLLKMALVYLGLFGVLWGLGLVVRGWQGAVLLLAPLAAWVFVKSWAWRRVSVQIDEEIVRYEATSPRDDFEVPLDALDAFYFDTMLESRPLILILLDGTERAVDELSESSGRALARALTHRGVRRL